ncbi:MAG TPA: urease accessory protein UreD [Gammaproteobacteria bacterium]|nr:urease accessory protein UreD [Gammaproteobacteria bacterium]
MNAARPQAAGWQAHLQLGFRRSGARTVLAERRHLGPLRVQRPFYPEGGLCHCYLIHPPGGVVGGDRLELEVRCEPGAQALLTTPGAGKFYRSAGPIAEQRQHLAVAAGASLEWLPQEQIVFDAARAESYTRVELEVGARFLGWEITCLGRPASGERWQHGHWRSRFELYRSGQPLLIERCRYRGGSAALTAAWGLAGFPLQAFMVVSNTSAAQLELSRSRLMAAADERLALTRLHDVLICRYMGHSAERARALFSELWALVRPDWLARPALPPRIWAT